MNTVTSVRNPMTSRLVGMGLAAIVCTATTLTALAASGKLSTITLGRAIRTDPTHCDVYATATGRYERVEFSTMGRWATPGRSLGKGVWTAHVFGHPGNDWAARTIVNGRPDATTAEESHRLP